MKNFFPLFLLLLNINNISAQQWEVIPYPDITDESLRIISLFEDNAGNVWGGNALAGRVIRWDGTNWELIPGSVHGMSFESPAIYSIFQDSDDKILFCSGDGIGVFDNNVWSNFNTSNSGMPYNFAFDGIEVDGVLWFSSRTSIFSFDGTTWTTYEIPDANWNALNLAAMDDGRIWVALANGDPIRRFDNGNWEVFDRNNTNVNSDYQYHVEKVDGETFWFGGPGGNGNLFENGDFTPSENILNWGMGTDYFTDIAANGSKDDVWFGSGYGLHHLDGDNWETFDTNNSPMTNNEVQTLMIAQDGKIWFSTQNEILIYTPATTNTDAETIETSTIRIHPNPVTDFLNVDITMANNSPLVEGQIKIIDLNGKTIMTRRTNNAASLTTVEVSALTAGFYLIEYTNGKQSVTKRFIKH